MWLQTKPKRKQEKISDFLKSEIEDRIERYAKKHFKKKYTYLDIHFRGSLCYIDCYTDPAVRTAEEAARLKKEKPESVIHLCRLRYTGTRNEWEFEFFSYSNEKYQPACFPSGNFLGIPEEAFDTAANLYLN